MTNSENGVVIDEQKGSKILEKPAVVSPKKPDAKVVKKLIDKLKNNDDLSGAAKLEVLSQNITGSGHYEANNVYEKKPDGSTEQHRSTRFVKDNESE
jgi:hypothetical protein